MDYFRAARVSDRLFGRLKRSCRFHAHEGRRSASMEALRCKHKAAYMVTKTFRRNSSRPPSQRTSSDIGEDKDEIPDECHMRKANRAPTFSEDGEMHLRWNAALKGRCVLDLSQEELQSLVEGGIPLKHRLPLWNRWFASQEPVKCEDLEERVIQADTAAQIDLDVPRTRPLWLGSVEQGHLRRLLHAFALQNPQIGYCQGLNDVGAVLIVLGFDEDTALSGLCTIAHNYCPGYHEPGLTGYLRDAAVLGALARRVLSQDALRCLESLAIPLEVLAAQHFLSLTACSWPLAATVQLWDLIFVSGQPALFASFLALLELYLPCCDASFESNTASTPPGAVAEAEEPLFVFQRAMQRGVEEDYVKILIVVRDLIPRISQSSIDQIRSKHLRIDHHDER